MISIILVLKHKINNLNVKKTPYLQMLRIYRPKNYLMSFPKLKHRFFNKPEEGYLKPS